MDLPSEDNHTALLNATDCKACPDIETVAQTALGSGRRQHVWQALKQQSIAIARRTVADNINCCTCLAHCRCVYLGFLIGHQAPHPVLEGDFKGLQPEVLLMRFHHLTRTSQLHPHGGHVQLIMSVQQAPLCQRQCPAAQVQLALPFQQLQMSLALGNKGFPRRSCIAFCA